jgi:hypothetical protein
MAKSKVATISEEDVGAFLARRSPPKPRHGSKKLSRRSDRTDLSEHFLSQFSVGNIYEVLVDLKGKRIDLDWIVKKYLKLLDDSFAKVAEKKVILDTLDLRGFRGEGSSKGPVFEA